MTSTCHVFTNCTMLWQWQYLWNVWCCVMLSNCHMFANCTMSCYSLYLKTAQCSLTSSIWNIFTNCTLSCHGLYFVECKLFWPDTYLQAVDRHDTNIHSVKCHVIPHITSYEMPCNESVHGLPTCSERSSERMGSWQETGISLEASPQARLSVADSSPAATYTAEILHENGPRTWRW